MFGCSLYDEIEHDKTDYPEGNYEQDPEEQEDRA